MSKNIKDNDVWLPDSLCNHLSMMNEFHVTEKRNIHMYVSESIHKFSHFSRPFTEFHPGMMFYLGKIVTRGEIGLVWTKITK